MTENITMTELGEDWLGNFIVEYHEDVSHVKIQTNRLEWSSRVTVSMLENRPAMKKLSSPEYAAKLIRYEVKPQEYEKNNSALLVKKPNVFFTTKLYVTESFDYVRRVVANKGIRCLYAVYDD